MEKHGIFEAIRRHLAYHAHPPGFGACETGFAHRDGDPKLVALQSVIHDVVGDATDEARGSLDPPGEDRRRGSL